MRLRHDDAQTMPLLRSHGYKPAQFGFSWIAPDGQLLTTEQALDVIDQLVGQPVEPPDDAAT